MTATQDYIESNIKKNVLLSLKDVTLFRGLSSRPIIKSLDLELKSGEILWLQGANGTGKSTLLKASAGIISPFCGEIKTYSSVGWLGHENALKLHLTARANLNISPFPAPKDGWGPITNRLHINKLLDIPVSELSSGQKRRVALTRLLGSNTRLWFLDEPDAGLDTGGSELLKEIMIEHVKKGGAIMAASHHAFEDPYAHSLQLKGREA